MFAALILCVCMQDSQNLAKPRYIAVPEFGMVKLSQDQKSVAVNMTIQKRIEEKVPYIYSVTVMKTEKDAAGFEKQVPRVEQKRGERTVVRTTTQAGKKLFKSKDVTLLKTNGKELTSDDLARLSAKKTVPAVILRTGQKLDPFFRLALKESTVVIVLPRPAAVPPPGARAMRLRPAIQVPVQKDK